MKIVSSKEKLIEAINIVQKAVPSKHSMQILEGILVEANDNFKMTANDLEIGIEYYIEADILEKGSIVIESRMFGEIIRKLPDSEVLIEVLENKTIIIDCENSHFELKGMSPEGFPSIPQIDKQNVFEIEQGLLKDMIRQTSFAVSIDDKRLVLTGSLMECKNNELYLVSIDGYRMALRRNIINGENNQIKVIIPGSTLNEIVKILQQDSNKVLIYNSENQIMFDLGECKIISRLIEGEYINYNNVLPEEYETKIIINRKEMLGSVERAALISIEEKKYPIKIEINEGKVIMYSSTNMGNAREEINVSSEGKKIEIGFNPKYFIDALKAIDDELIAIYFSSNIGPCIIKSIDKNNYAYMILPVRISEE